jgi:hypothetical protein
MKKLLFTLLLVTLAASFLFGQTAATASTPTVSVVPVSSTEAAAIASADTARTNAQQAVSALYVAFSASPAVVAAKQALVNASEAESGLVHQTCAAHNVDCTSGNGYVYSMGNQAFLKGQRGAQRGQAPVQR